MRDATSIDNDFVSNSRKLPWLNPESAVILHKLFQRQTQSIQASEATIRDADVALEVSERARHQVLLQSGNAMLVQATIGSLQVLFLL